MRAKRRAKKVLKQYGKAAYRQRVHYVNSMTNLSHYYAERISWRYLVKRGFIIAVVLTLSFALLVVSASALGIKLFNFSFINKSDHVEIVKEKKNGEEENFSVNFCAVEYIPSEYAFVSEDKFADTMLNRVYENRKEEYLYVEQAVADDYNTNLDNEDCTVSTKIIREMEVYVYDYGELKVYMMQKGNLVIRIKGRLKDEEFEKIIYGLKFE